MFSRSRTLVREDDLPPVLHGGERSKEPPPGKRSGSIAPAGIVFPPFSFDFSCEMDNSGNVRCTSTLSETDVLFCLPYSSDGASLEFEPESFALAWAFLLNSKNRVICRPGHQGLFVAGYVDELCEFLKHAGFVVIEYCEDREHLKPVDELLFASGRLLAGGSRYEHTSIRADLDHIASRFPDDLVHIEIYSGGGGETLAYVSPTIPGEVFGRCRAEIFELYGNA